MEKYIEAFFSGYKGYYNYLVSEITNPQWGNYFYGLLIVSVIIYALEIYMPWRKNQKPIRKGFWLDLFYLFFNFFLFSLVGYNAVSDVVVLFINDGLAAVGVTNLVALQVQSLPVWSQLLLMFVIADFIQWNIHRLLHRVPWLWKFHKVHHSVKEMGFSAQFRFHFMETIFYKSLQYFPLAAIGFGIQDFFIVHITAVLIGHINHANLNWDYGWFKYILNNPKMHLWHHAKALPEAHPTGMNFGLSLSIWDYLFKTAYLPHHDPYLELGFHDDEDYPTGFVQQSIQPFKERS